MPIDYYRNPWNRLIGTELRIDDTKICEGIFRKGDQVLRY